MSDLMEPVDRADLVPPHDLGTGDFSLYPIDHAMVAAALEDRTVRVEWDDGHVSRFHFPWLRDNCPCCVHPYTQEQVFELAAAVHEIRPEDVLVSDVGALEVRWSGDGHASRYHPGWLREHCYSEGSRRERLLAPVLWDASTRARPDGFDWGAVVADEEVELAWLSSIRDTGCAVIHGAPLTDDAVGEIAGRIGVLRETNFGRLFDVRVDTDPVSNSNTGLELPPHTDLPTREYQPGLQLLHCLVNDVAGGLSLLVDGYRVAAELRDRSPRFYELLTTHPWDFANRSRTSDYRWRAPMIGVDSDGNWTGVRVGNWLRGPLDAPFDLVEELYEAYRAFEGLSHQARFQIRFRLDPGDCLIFDNRRLLHGRTSLGPGAGRRHLRGCYMDRDELRSRLNMLERRRRARKVVAGQGP